MNQRQRAHDRRRAQKQEEILKVRKKRRKKRIITLIAELLVLCLLGVTSYGMLKLDLLNYNKLDNVENNGVELSGYMNVALFGTDNRKGETAGVRSDCIIVASVNNDTKEVKLLSVYRDTFLKIDDEKYSKANSAYAYGGPEQAVNMLNRNLDMDIEDYVSVNFLALADVIDLLGGLDIEMTDEEVCHMNNYCVETSEITGKTYTKIEPEVAGTYHLNGVQSVSFTRIRYTAGGDMTRTARQRLVIEKIVEKAKSADLTTLNDILDTVFPEITTSFTATEILQLGTALLDYTIGESKGFPFDVADSDQISGYEGSFVIPVDLAKNVTEAHKFLFPDMTYTPTNTLKQISNDIAYLTGYGADNMYSTDSNSDSSNDSSDYDYDYDNGYDSGSYDNSSGYDDNSNYDYDEGNGSGGSGGSSGGSGDYSSYDDDEAYY